MSRRILLAVMAVFVALFLAAALRYSGKAPVTLPAGSCNAGLWDHVYSRERLRVIAACTAVEGRVAFMEREVDGDMHIGLVPDQPSVLNLMNATHGGGRLVVEVICEHAPARDRAAAVAACAGFAPHVTIPTVGDHVRVTGAYVTDRHNGWNEVHPVTNIEILR